jgi:hypothetical protein
MPNVILQSLLLSLCYYSNYIFRFCAAQTAFFFFVLFSSFLCPRSQPLFDVVAELRDLYFGIQNEKSFLLIIKKGPINKLNPNSHLSVSIANYMSLFKFHFPFLQRIN